MVVSAKEGDNMSKNLQLIGFFNMIIQLQDHWLSTLPHILSIARSLTQHSPSTTFYSIARSLTHYSPSHTFNCKIIDSLLSLNYFLFNCKIVDSLLFLTYFQLQDHWLSTLPHILLQTSGIRVLSVIKVIAKSNFWE